MLERNVVIIGYSNMEKRCKKKLSIKNANVLIVKKCLSSALISKSGRAIGKNQFSKHEYLTNTELTVIHQDKMNREDDNEAKQPVLMAIS